jgi:hypothetical protein
MILPPDKSLDKVRRSKRPKLPFSGRYHVDADGVDFLDPFDASPFLDRDRQAQLTFYARRLFQYDKPAPTVYRRACRVNVVRCRPPLADDEVRALVDQEQQDHERRIGPPPEPPPAGMPHPFHQELVNYIVYFLRDDFRQDEILALLLGAKDTEARTRFTSEEVSFILWCRAHGTTESRPGSEQMAAVLRDAVQQVRTDPTACEERRLRRRRMADEFAPLPIARVALNPFWGSGIPFAGEAPCRFYDLLGGRHARRPRPLFPHWAQPQSGPRCADRL